MAQHDKNFFRKHHARTESERLRLRAQIDAIVSLYHNLGGDGLKWILRECDHPTQILSSRDFTTNADPKGFWRIDKNKDPELRHTVLTQVAFQDLESIIRAVGGNRENGIKTFLAQNHGEGWMLPESIRLAEYGLGHDDRAQSPQPVASRLGPRFYDWQLFQSADESWRECHLHARNLLGASEYARLISSSHDVQPEDSLPLVAESQLDYTSSKHGQKFLFPPQAATKTTLRRTRMKDKPS